MGVSANLGHSFTINSSAFLRSQSNIIDWVNTPFSEMPRKSNLYSNSAYALAKNIRSVENKGLEIELTYQKAMTSKHHIYANIGATILRSTSNDPKPVSYTHLDVYKRQICSRCRSAKPRPNGLSLIHI